MKPIIIESPKFCEAVSWFIDVYAITLFPFIICRDKSDKLMINHERIHIRQQLELLVIGFWLLYLLNWFINLIIYRFDTMKSYMQISFEKEAYANERNLDYLSKRGFFSWLNYLTKD